MKKILLAATIIGFLVSSYSCKKPNESIDKQLTLVEKAQSYFENQVANTTLKGVNSHVESGIRNPRKTQAKFPLWSKASVGQFSTGEAVIVPVHYAKPFLIKTNIASNQLYNIDDLSYLVIYQDKSGSFHAEHVTRFPDSLNQLHSQDRFSGLVTVEDWFGKPLTKFISSANGPVRQFRETSETVPNTTLTPGDNDVAASRVITVCYEISGYNYSKNDPSGGYYWTEPAGCSSIYLPEENFGNTPRGENYISASDFGLGGSYSIDPVQTATILPGKDVIYNYKNYTKCFDIRNSPGYSYQVTLSVAQPSPGTRMTWTFNPVSGASSSANDVIGVGHTFLVLKETTPSGVTVRNIGFYPSMSVDPSSPTSIGNLNNDEFHEYDISVSIDLNSDQFSSLLKYIGTASSGTLIYDLNIFNCTTFAVSALSSIGYEFPRTSGSWPNGSGLNPGDLGEDLRQMNLAGNMVRNTGTSNHGNEGQCN